MKKQSERRLAENEVIFREANRDAKDFMKDIGAAGSTTIPFYCECSDAACQARIELPVTVYEEIHTNKQHFVVLPGHEVETIETIVHRSPEYYIVEKRINVPAQADVATALKRLSLEGGSHD